MSVKKVLLQLAIMLSLFGVNQAVTAAPPANLPENARVEVTGTLEVFIREDLGRGVADLEFFLTRGNGAAPIQLLFADGPPKNLRSGIGIQVRGIHSRGKIQVEAANFEAGAAVPDGAQSSAAAIEQHSAVVIMVDLDDVQHSASEISNMAGYYFGAGSSMEDMYHQISFGQLDINGDIDNLDGDGIAEPDGLPDVVGPVSTSLTSAQMCSNPFSHVAEILAQAATRGLDTGFYQHRIYALPRSLGCGWTGYANVGCSTCNAFNIWSHDVNTTSHEFGHHLGFAHASTDPNNDGVIDGEYNDYSSFMGYSLNGNVRALDGAHHWQAGWYGSYDNLSLQTVSASGLYSITSLQEGAPSVAAPSLLRINVANGRPYFLSARQAVGYDEDLANINSSALAGVNIHRYNGSGYDNTRLVAQLGADGVFSDAANNLVIRQVGAKDGAGITTVDVDLGDQTCIQRQPTVTLTPVNGKVAGGEQFTFNVDLTNNDATSCGAAIFALYLNEDSVAFSSLPLGPGQSASTSIAIDGGYEEGSIPVQIFSQTTDHPTATVTGSLTVDLTGPDPVADLSGTYQKKGRNHRVNLSWSSSASADVAVYEIYRGDVMVSSNSQTSLTDTLDGNNLATDYTYTVYPVDDVGNTGNAATVTVATSSDSDGGGNGNGNGKGGGKKPK